MKSILALFLVVLFSTARADFSQGELAQIGKRVWRNECNGTIEGLTSWNAGEDFASLGIGHFIWYPKNQRGPFEESFPKLVTFCEARGEKPPAFTRGACPWNSRAEFRRDFHDERMNALRKFLAGTIALQTDFLVQRMQQSLPKMLAQTSNAEKVRRNFERLSQSSHGVFALIDYVNFKGEGTLATERYKGEGWGLLQVLETMRNSDDAVRAFSDAAKEVLTRRVQNAPVERHEERWLTGWKNRVESYAAGS